MPNLPIFVISTLGYVVFARLALLITPRKVRSNIFCLVNIAGVVWFSLLTRHSEWEAGTILSLGPYAVLRHICLIGAYVVVISAGYFLLNAFSKRNGWLPWIAFFYPLAILIAFRYFHFIWGRLTGYLDWDEWVIAATIVGLSYMAFRLSYLVLEVRNGTVEMPTLDEYLGFAFFVPTLLIGPISPYGTHKSSMDSLPQNSVPVGRCLTRIVVGATKFLFLANLVNQLSYSGLFLDGKNHTVFDLGIAAISYYLYLYLNFSGFCDIAIGTAALIGIKVKENFDNPFIAKNVKEFWNRWHITLSEYMRDVIFAPLSKKLIRNLGARYANFSIVIAIFAVFLTIGIWHGVGWNYAVFGLIHGVGVSANHYYTIWLKRSLGKQRYRAYNENRVVNFAATGLTFIYVAASLFFFANSPAMMRTIWNALII